MPYYVFNFSDDFREKIIDRFVACYLRAETPNPCIDCNRYMKFDKLLSRAEALDCDHVATGHYVRTEQSTDGFLLKKAVFEEKDQSYVLYMLGQAQLSRLLFPLGGLSKPQVRELAARFAPNVAAKPDSQDICFVPDGDYARIIELHTGARAEPGDFVDQAGRVLGRHNGIIRYTIGQRRGLGLPMGERIYVTDIDPDANTVTLGPDAALFSREVRVKELNWTLGSAPGRTFRCSAKIRYRHREQPAEAQVQEDGTVLLVFDAPQRAATPGQAAVLYRDDQVLGGGVISRAR
jgi:tRNA-specific 2-thiouridylase